MKLPSDPRGRRADWRDSHGDCLRNHPAQTEGRDVPEEGRFLTPCPPLFLTSPAVPTGLTGVPCRVLGDTQN